jgi:hypothetical protein
MKAKSPAEAGPPADALNVSSHFTPGGRHNRPRSLGEDLIWALRLVRDGYAEGEIVRALAKKHPKYGYHSVIYAELIQARGSEPAMRYAERTVRKAIAIAKEEPRVWSPNEARGRLQDIWAQVDVEPWPLNLAGPRRALEAAFWIGFERGWVANMNLDIRTHALRAGQSRWAVQRHRVVLHELGWLKRNPHDRGTKTSRFSFFSQAHHIKTFGERPPMVRADVILNHDAFRASAYGDLGWYLTHLEASRRCVRGAPYKDYAESILEHLDVHALKNETDNAAYRDWERFRIDRREQAEGRNKEVSHAS